jgi:predicted aldo/keto reductase-like oxidoreductase
MLAAPTTAETRNGIPYRVLGRTGEKVSLLGLGGYHMGVDSLSDEQSIRLVRTAMDEGVNFLDNAWEYTNGRSETLMGKALKDGYREKAFLMSKVVERSREGAQQQLEESLRRLDVDVIDLWQFHSLRSPEDARAVFENLLDIAVKAREAGKIRYIGFTGHMAPEAHLEMLKQDFEWASIQMPLSIFDYHYRSFQQQVLPKAVEQNVGVIAMKTLAGKAVPHQEGVLSVEEMWRYSMNLPVSTVVTGLDSLEKLQDALRVFKSYRPMEAEEKAALLAKVEPHAKEGKFEYYKAWKA